jgi:hypothetical protein
MGASLVAKADPDGYTLLVIVRAHDRAGALTASHLATQSYFFLKPCPQMQARRQKIKSLLTGNPIKRGTAPTSTGGEFAQGLKRAEAMKNAADQQPQAERAMSGRFSTGRGETAVERLVLAGHLEQ